jgi:hypothetical protein
MHDLPPFLRFVWFEWIVAFPTAISMRWLGRSPLRSFVVTTRRPGKIGCAARKRGVEEEMMSQERTDEAKERDLPAAL